MEPGALFQVTNEMIAEFIGEFLTDVTIYARFESESPVAGAPNGAIPIRPMEWSQLGQNRKSVPPLPETAESVPGLLRINRNITLKYDPDRWKAAAPDQPGELTLTHASGDGHVMVIAESIAVSRGSVEDIALANAQAVDPKARIVFRQQRKINGADIRFLRIEADVNTVPIAYWGCFYGGEYGTVQVVTYAAKISLPKYEKDFMDLLDGLMVSR